MNFEGDDSAEKNVAGSDYSSKGKDFKGEDYAGKDYTGKDYAGKDDAGKDDAGMDYGIWLLDYTGKAYNN